MKDWIKVSDRYPTPGEKVLAYTDIDDNCYSAVWTEYQQDIFYRGERERGHWEITCGEPVLYSPEPSHWTELITPGRRVIVGRNK